MARRIIAALLIILATILAPFGAGALWAERTITEADTFTETLAPLAEAMTGIMTPRRRAMSMVLS